MSLLKLILGRRLANEESVERKITAFEGIPAMDAQLRDEGPLDLRHTEPPIVLIVTEGWNRLIDRALQFALRLSSDVIAVHLTVVGRSGRSRAAPASASAMVRGRRATGEERPA